MMPTIKAVVSGLMVVTLAGCQAPSTLMPLPGTGVSALGRASNPPTVSADVRSFAVSAAVVGYTADALLKVAADVRKEYGRNPQALSQSQLRVTLTQVVQDTSKTTRNLDVTSDWSKLLESSNPTKTSAMKLLEVAKVSYPYPVNYLQGFLTSIPTGEKAGTAIVYYLKVEGFGPVASRGQRYLLGEQFVSDYGKNFKAVAE